MHSGVLASSRGYPQMSIKRDLDRLGVARVPDGWRLMSVGKACSIRNEKRLPLSTEERVHLQGMFPYYGPTGILGYINDHRFEGDFALIGEDGDHFLDVVHKRQTIRVSGKFNVNNHAHVIAGTEACLVDWFFYFFQHRDITHSLTRQGAGRFKLTKAALERLPILVPPLPEQQSIAELLRSWDEAIEKLGSLRAMKQARLQALVTSLVSKGPGEKCLLGKYLREVSVRNRDLKIDRVLSVTNSAGFVLSEEQFAHRVASADLSNYKVVLQGQYAYNPSRLNVGSIARLDTWDEGVLSPMYVVFEVMQGLDIHFFSHWLSSAETKQRIKLAAQGSVRDTVGFVDLCSIAIPVPPPAHQRTVANALNAGAEEIKLIERQRETIVRQKAGLMQMLLTGERRVTRGAGND